MQIPRIHFNNITLNTVDSLVHNFHIHVQVLKSEYYNTGLFISPSGTSELDCATTKTDTAERSISIGRESLEVFCTRDLSVLADSTAKGQS